MTCNQGESDSRAGALHHGGFIALTLSVSPDPSSTSPAQPRAATAAPPDSHPNPTTPSSRCSADPTIPSSRCSAAFSLLPMPPVPAPEPPPAPSSIVDERTGIGGFGDGPRSRSKSESVKVVGGACVASTTQASRMVAGACVAVISAGTEPAPAPAQSPPLDSSTFPTCCAPAASPTIPLCGPATPATGPTRGVGFVSDGGKNPPDPTAPTELVRAFGLRERGA